MDLTRPVNVTLDIAQNMSHQPEITKSVSSTDVCVQRRASKKDMSVLFAEKNLHTLQATGQR